MVINHGGENFFCVSSLPYFSEQSEFCGGGQIETKNCGNPTHTPPPLECPILSHISKKEIDF